MSSPPYLFDTGALIDVYRGRQRIRPYFESLADQTAYVSVISEAELWMGLRADETARHEALLYYFVPLGVDLAMARQAGEWMQRYRHQGLGWMDALIVATSVLAGVPTLTRDRRLSEVLAGEATFILYD